jgi:hypothetical protein
MGTTRATSVILTVLAYVLVTFAVQAVSHFAINAEHYRSISFMRAQPIFFLGVLSMLIQGTVFGLLFPVFDRGPSRIRSGLLFSWILGGFLASYIVLAEPGKYAIPSVASWVRVELVAAAAQFTLFGLLLGLVHGRNPTSGRS